MKIISTSLMIGLALSLGHANAWSADSAGLCAAWSARATALNQRRSSSEMLELRPTAERLAIITQLALLNNNPSLSEEERAKVRSWMAQISNLNPDTNALSRVKDEMSQLMDKTYGVVEQDSKWNELLRAMNIQVLPIAKDQYPAFIEKILALAGSGKDVNSMRQELLGDPNNLSNMIPGARLANCGETYLFYQANQASPGLSVQDNVTLGNIGKIAENPYGDDKGVLIHIESLHGNDDVNQLNIDLHRLLKDAPGSER